MPEFNSVEELTKFFDSHDTAKYLSEMPEAHFDMDIQRRSFLISVDEQLMKNFPKLQNLNTHLLKISLMNG